MKELKLGKISTQDLASWFGISYGSLRNNRKKKLEELKEYCLFEECYGGIIVKDIYIKEYVNKKQSNYKIVKSHTDECWDKSGLDTKKDVTEKLYSKYKDELTIKKTTTYDYVRKASNELYGPANNYEQSGEIGNCWYRICVINEKGERRLLTKEEQERREKIREKYCSKENKKHIEDIKDSLEKKYRSGKITRETKLEMFDDLDSWRWTSMMEFEKTLAPGESLTYGTFKYNFEKSEVESAF